MPDTLSKLLEDIRRCQLCLRHLPEGPRPVLSVGARSRLLIIGQAPGIRVHRSGIPWDDASGNRLREWMGIDKTTFYNDDRIAILPMGFCYPGSGRSGDLPPRPECAPQWHEAIRKQLPDVRLTLLVGRYAQRYYLPDAPTNLTETVKAWQTWLPDYLVLPHPSPRNQRWFKANPWFEAEVVPHLQCCVRALL